MSTPFPVDEFRESAQLVLRKLCGREKHLLFRTRAANVGRVFYRDARGAVRQRLKPKVVANNGISLVAKNSTISPHMRKQIYFDHYEDPELRILKSTVQETDRVLELGGGVGYISTFLSKLCGDQNVTTVEANPELGPIIEENHRLNGVHPRVINKIATCGTETSATIFLAHNFWGSSTVKPSDRPAVVPTVNLNALIEEFRPTYQVMDVEGAEAEIVPQLRFGSVEKLLIEVHPQIMDDDGINNIVAQLIQAGFRIDFEISIKLQLFMTRAI